ncbi:MAG: hypothetical protein ABFS56_01800 [Pseudomonadota bacterium]
MAAKTLRGLAKDYFDDQCDRETYLLQRTQLIDKITEGAIGGGREPSTPIAKYAIVAGMIVVGGVLGVFWVLKEPIPSEPEQQEEVLASPGEEKHQAAAPDTSMLVEAPEAVAEQEPQTVPLEEPPPSEPALQEDSAAGSSLDEEEPQAANSDDIEAPPVVNDQSAETKASLTKEPQIKAENVEAEERLTEPEKAKIAQLLRQCQEHFKAQRLVTGNGGKTALVCYREVLEIDSDNADARAGLKAIEQRYEEWAERALDENRFNSVKKYLDRLETVNPKSPALADLRQRLEQAGRPR